MSNLEHVLERIKNGYLDKSMPPEPTDADIAIIDAIAEINDLKQQIKELHASRESLLAYKEKIENPDYVLVPIKLNKDMYEAMSNHLYGCCGGIYIDEDDTWHDVIEASKK